MKVFTVGMDEKPTTKDNPVSPDGVTVASTPIITFEKKRTSYKNYVMCLGMLFFILLFTIIVSKLVYYRIPDDLGLPWFELKRRIGVGCDDCMSTRIIQSFYPQRSSRVFESSNNAAPPAALAMQAGQFQTNGEDLSTSQHFESESSIDLPQVTDSRLDFLRKIIPKIKEQAEKSGIEGVMQVKVLQMDSFKPKQLLDRSDENQLQSGINAIQSPDFMAPFRPTLLSDLLRWNTVDNDESQTLRNQFFGSQQDDIAKSGRMLILGPFLQPQQLSLLPGSWDNNNNIAWSNSLQPRLFDLSQQISKQQQWNNLWQWPIPIYNKNSNEKLTQWQNMQWSNNHLLTPAVQQNPSPVWENGNRWQDNVQVGSNWQNSIQNGANNNRWLQNEWQGQGQQQQFWSQYPQTWQASVNQNNNDWNTQRANIVDNLDERMIQAVLPNDNNNLYNNANDQWNRYYIQWHTNNQRLRQQPIANNVVSQSLEITEPVPPRQIQDQSLGQQQSQIADSLQSQTVLEQQIESLSPQAQQQKQQPQPIGQFPNKPIQPQINTIPNEAFRQNPSVPVAPNESDDNVPQTIAPFIFNNDDWKKIENPNLLVRPISDNQEHLQLPHPQRPQLSIHPIENVLIDSSGDTKMTDDELNKVPIVEQTGPMNDISRGLSNPVLFQVDEPPPKSANMDESFAK
ncbi:unnamed protein product [Cercopithifilaria johnstoni]|uniref:Uncharacterized protein n=1 Tax=Cercopithifilaria johnstoni TaxID=2874296 RepID=A0A8J2Q230_9BILA|nr:unnamed protein product [Cercopithifilaria johnstoni]